MPTIMSHAVLPLAIGLARPRLSRRIVGLGMLAAMLPDADVIGFAWGVPYDHALGHRGASHSLLAAALLAMIASLWANSLRTKRLAAAAFIFLAAASHGLLDTLTNGGKGAALLWPVTELRFFATVQPIEVSPLGLQSFVSRRGLEVLASEAIWIWLPATLLVALYRRVTLCRSKSDPQ